MTDQVPAEVVARIRRPTRSQVRLEDVAKLAYVSRATASRVINSPGAVSAKTRERVEKAIAELGWIPDGAAQALASLKTRTIGALIPALGHQSIASMLDGLRETLGQRGYTLLLGQPDARPERTLDAVAKMIQSRVDCIVLMGDDQPRELFDMLARRKMFHIVIYTIGSRPEVDYIGFDNRRAMQRLVEHLLDLGHTTFGMIARDYTHNDRIRLRVDSVRDTLARAGLAVRPQHLKIVPFWGIGCGRQGMRDLLTEDIRPTAVICTNDYLAFGAIAEARASGLSVPANISIAGFDDVELAAHAEPSLTTVRVPARDLGEAIGAYITQALGTGEAVLPDPFECELVVRGSTAPPPA